MVSETRSTELIRDALEAFSQRAPDIQARRTRVTQQFNSEGRLAGIQARTLVLGAMQDRVIDPVSSWRMAQDSTERTWSFPLSSPSPRLRSSSSYQT